jgi:predicted transcriptional regulator
MKRNDLQIQAELLDIARSGSKKTRLVYQGNLNFRIIMPYLERMIDAGLMILLDGLYYTTEKGHKWVEAFKELMLLQGL